MSRLDDKILIVTGSTQGIGEAIAISAAEMGAAGIVICGRQKDKGERVEATIREKGCAAVYVPADLSSVEDCERVVQTCDEQFGRVDCLVNSAADTSRGTLEDTTVALWDYLFALNVRAPFLLTQACVRIMRREQISGSIVNIASIAGYCGQPMMLGYSTTKGALATMTSNCANALKEERIRVNAVMLGWVDTPGEDTVMRNNGFADDWLKTAEQAMPFGRLIKAADVARLCVYLLSDESGVMTGSLVDYAQRASAFVPPVKIDW
ncbi:MAG: SDR family oxidoreductase [Pirellulaceae bacterium]|nr:SDR family oxidoreductase [Pirellulaceae bacterium]